MTEITGQIQKPWLFKKGQSGNPAGKPKGALNWSTIAKKAIKKIAKEKNWKIKDVDVELVVTALSQALKGNYVFWKDIMDRTYGTTEKPSTLIGIDQRQIEIKPILGGRTAPCPKCGYEFKEKE